MQPLHYLLAIIGELVLARLDFEGKAQKGLKAFFESRRATAAQAAELACPVARRALLRADGDDGSRMVL